MCSTPVGIVGIGTRIVTPNLTARSSAQRLSASWGSAPPRLHPLYLLHLCAQRLSASWGSAQHHAGNHGEQRGVLNACRHRGDRHWQIFKRSASGRSSAQRLSASWGSAHFPCAGLDPGRLCSTPVGIVGIGTSRIRMVHEGTRVLNACRHRGDRHRPSSTPAAALRSAQRLSASWGSAPPPKRTTEVVKMCSTPVGIVGIGTSVPYQAGPASRVLNACRHRGDRHVFHPRPLDAQHDVLNACRHRGDRHSGNFQDVASPSSAQRLSASWGSAHAARSSSALGR